MKTCYVKMTSYLYIKKAIGKSEWLINGIISDVVVVASYIDVVFEESQQIYKDKLCYFLKKKGCD